MTNDHENKTAAQQVRDLVEAWMPYWRPRWEAMQELRDFLDGDRYEENLRRKRDRRLIQIRGQETQDTVRHIMAKATERPRSVEAIPQDKVDDPDISEIVASIVTWDLGKPYLDFEEQYEMAIQACREARLGVVWMDWEPDLGPFGERIYTFQPGERIMWEAPYNPHHPKCSWLIRFRRMDVDEARETYKAPWLEPDREMFTAGGAIKPGVPLLQDSSGSDMPTLRNIRDNKVTLLECWKKRDRTTKAAEPEDTRELDPAARYMACLACGHKSDPQGMLLEGGQIESELPEMIEASCPECGGDLERIDAVDTYTEKLRYEKGKRLTIIAPHQQGPDDKALYDDGWPIPTARSFPGLFLSAYIKPGEPFGPCDVDLMWDQQVASDQLRTMAIQRVFEHRNYWELPEHGINDHKGKRFRFREDQYNVMYRDASVMGPLDVRVHSASGLDPAWSVAFEATQAALTQYRPAADFGAADISTRDIPVGTTERIVEQAELSTEHFNRRKNRALGQFYGVVWDYIKATMTREQAMRLQLDGIALVIDGLMGDDFPDYDFQLADSPQFTRFEEFQIRAFTSLMQVATTTPAFLEVFGEVNNIPRSIIRKVQRVVEQQQAMAAQMGLGPGGPMAAGGPAADPPMPEDEMNADAAFAGEGT